MEQFESRVAELRPELAWSLNYVRHTDALRFRLYPVGFILAQHEIRFRAPQLADPVDAALEEASHY